ncbi:MAG: GIY-YIG nuclease family protein [Candidatus Omnitrophica bacterium]|nr:GIY-YIG nuclease family protein [Candidatus Omnitrophota bacterium]MBU4478050.1 GIY-YIG nuclease family protein [Candidatus Omnitrophota bacterium]
MCKIYILKSKKDGNIYTGSTTDIEKRLRYHNSGKVRSTKARRPLDLIYTEECQTRTQARQRENFLKSGQGRKWIEEEILKRRSGRAV